MGDADDQGQRSVETYQHQAQQLLAMLLAPSTSSNERQEILQIFKSNPPLLAAFIRERQQQRQSRQDHATQLYIDPLYIQQSQWQQSITDVERSHLIDLVASRINDFRIPGGPGVYPHHVEFSVYQLSSSKDEYYRQLAEKIRQVESELEEKLRARSNLH